MAQAKRVRWECPNDLHSAVLASTKPPADSIARYCLECSAHKGRLVKRVARSLEKKRAAKNEKAREKQRRKRAKEREKEAAYYTVAGVDLRKEMKRMLRLKAFDNAYAAKRLRNNAPQLKVRRAQYPPNSRLGFAEYWSNTISVTTYPGQSEWEIKEILLHELCHLVAGHNTGDAHPHHGDHFKRVFREAGWEYFGDAPGLGFDNIYVGAFADLMRRKEETQSDLDAAFEHERAGFPESVKPTLPSEKGQNDKREEQLTREKKPRKDDRFQFYTHPNLNEFGPRNRPITYIRDTQTGEIVASTVEGSAAEPLRMLLRYANQAAREEAENAS